MARPKITDGPPATARLEAAFFTVLRTMPFQKVTVGAIVAAAGVNRNSFYYHYADLDDLARSAVANLLIPEIPRLLAGGFGLESPQVDEVIARAIGEDRFANLLTIAGPHSTAELRGILKSAVIDLWLEVFHLDHRQLGPRQLAAMDFMFGGMLGLMSSVESRRAAEPHDLLDVIADLRRLPVLQVCAREMMQALGGVTAPTPAATSVSANPSPHPDVQ